MIHKYVTITFLHFISPVNSQYLLIKEYIYRSICNVFLVLATKLKPLLKL